MQKTILLILFVALALAVAPSANGYRCKETMTKYFEYSTTKNWTGLATILNDDVIWTIPGLVGSNQPPFQGVWNGKAGVLQFFKSIGETLDMFYNSEFDEGTRSFHDEAIKARKSGFYYRAPVAHEWHFDNDCLVTKFTGYYDTYNAFLAYQGNYNAFPTSAAIPNTVTPVQGLDNITSDEAASVATEFFLLGGAQQLLADDVRVFVQGQQNILPFAGVFFGKEQFYNGHLKPFQEAISVVNATINSLTMADHGRVALFPLLKVQSKQNAEFATIPLCLHVLVNGQKLIQQISYYWDATNLLGPLLR